MFLDEAPQVVALEALQEELRLTLQIVAHQTGAAACPNPEVEARRERVVPGLVGTGIMQLHYLAQHLSVACGSCVTVGQERIVGVVTQLVGVVEILCRTYHILVVEETDIGSQTQGNAVLLGQDETIYVAAENSVS